MKKKLFGIFLAIAVLAALSTVAYAAVDYTMDFSQDTSVDWNGSSLVDYSTENDNGTGWRWVSSSKTLTLTGLQFSTSAGTAIKLPAGATLVLSGNSTATSTYGEDVTDTVGLFCDGALSVSGTGSLTVTGSAVPNTNSYGVFVDAGAITVSGGTLTGIGGTSSAPSGKKLRHICSKRSYHRFQRRAEWHRRYGDRILWHLCQ